MNFETALGQVKTGRRAFRSGWNGRNMFIFLVPGSTFEANRPPLLGIYPRGHQVTYRSHIDMKTVDDEIVPWIASQSDLLADDWELVV